MRMWGEEEILSDRLDRAGHEARASDLSTI